MTGSKGYLKVAWGLPNIVTSRIDAKTVIGHAKATDMSRVCYGYSKARSYTEKPNEHEIYMPAEPELWRASLAQSGDLPPEALHLTACLDHILLAR